MQFKIILTLLILVTLTVTLFSGPVYAGEADGIDWQEHNNGFKQARSQGKPVFMDFYAECPFCAVMENSTYRSDDVLSRTDEFVFIRVNGVEEPDRLTEYNIEIYPTVIFLMPDGTELGRLKGYINETYLTEQMDIAGVLFEESYDPSKTDYPPLDDDNDDGPSDDTTFIYLAAAVVAAITAVVIGVIIRIAKKGRKG